MGILRFLLALSVLLSHLQYEFHISLFGYQIVGGQVAVVAFFIISGFYMSLILNEKYINIKHSYFLYITNRALRIFPLYWLVLIITYPVISSLGQIDVIRDTFVYKNTLFNLINLIQNIVGNVSLFITTNGFIYIPKLYTNFYVSSAWSLSVEFIFYLLAPFLVKGSTKKVLFIFLILEFLRIYLTHINKIYSIYSTPFLFLPNLPFFLIGALSYRLYKKLLTIRLNKMIYYTLTFTLIIFIIIYNFIPPIFFYTFKQYVFYFMIFLIAPFMFVIEKDLKFSKLLGDLSYPLYISHIITIDIFNYFIIRSMPKAWQGFFDIIIVIVLSILLKKYISDPIENYRSTRVKKTIVSTKKIKYKKNKLAFEYITTTSQTDKKIK
jgi:peptidoglycan/LPS O-acetylase OafA/YrhL